MNNNPAEKKSPLNPIYHLGNQYLFWTLLSHLKYNIQIQLYNIILIQKSLEPFGNIITTKISKWKVHSIRFPFKITRHTKSSCIASLMSTYWPLAKDSRIIANRSLKRYQSFCSLRLQKAYKFHNLIKIWRHRNKLPLLYSWFNR